MNEQKVYLFFCNDFPSDVFDSKEKAFNKIPQDEFTEITQSIRTCDGVEEIIPTKDNFYLDAPIYVHVKAHTEELMGMSVECKEETYIYKIKEFKVK